MRDQPRPVCPRGLRHASPADTAGPAARRVQSANEKYRQQHGPVASGAFPASSCRNRYGKLNVFLSLAEAVRTFACPAIPNDNSKKTDSKPVLRKPSTGLKNIAAP